jgi:Asp-tRNA(Asn)/Glu-tRNA(Gln) amidotransferase A subunit family amidase
VGSVLLPANPGPPGPVPLTGPAAPPRRLLSPSAPNGTLLRLAAALDLPVVAAPILGDDEITDLLAAFRTVQAAEAWELHGHWITANPGALHADVEARFRAGAGVDPGTRKRAAEVIAGHREKALGVIGPDAWLVQPATAGPGHARDAAPADKDVWRQATLRHTVIASAFGLPSCVIPGVVGPPAGLELVGPPGADHALLRAALAVAGS